jgi:opacity protein-like surface antigen
VTSALRSIPLLGAELAHIDLGHPSGRPSGLPTDASMRGTAAFGVLHLPLPVPMVDVYAKAGLARLKSTLHYTAFRPGVGACSVNDPTCSLQPLQVDRIDTAFAGGAGVQFKLNSWALRAEFKQFIAAGGHPGLVSVGFTWNFP